MDFMCFLNNRNGTPVIAYGSVALLVLSCISTFVHVFRNELLYGSRGLPVLYVDECVLVPLVKRYAMKMNGEWS